MVDQMDVEFLQRGVFDHSAMVILIGKQKNFGPKPFKFFGFWAEHENFLSWPGG